MILGLSCFCDRVVLRLEAEADRNHVTKLFEMMKLLNWGILGKSWMVGFAP